MTKTLAQVGSSDTFQVWLQRTNDIISELGSSVVTASALGDITQGSVIISGSFTSNCNDFDVKNSPRDSAICNDGFAEIAIRETA